MATDVISSAAKTVTTEVRASQIDDHAWLQDAAMAARAELQRVRAAVTATVNEGISAATGNASEHCGGAIADLTRAHQHIARYVVYAAAAAEAASSVDHILVDRLLAIGGADPAAVTAVRRVPNLRLKVDVWRDTRQIRAALEAAFDGCSREAVVVNAVRFRHKNARQLTA